MILVSVLAGSAPDVMEAQEAEDELGSWLIWNGTVRFSDRWSLFTEAQLRLFEVVFNVNETIVRAAGHFYLSPQAYVGLGYMRSRVWPFNEATSEDAGTTENRIYQQFTIGHPWDRAGFEHRYRLEQRWLNGAAETDYSNRARYRLQITTPVNKPSMEPGAYFINFYNEIFLNLGSEPTFDQNRLYIAGGRQFTQQSNLQLGALWQARSSANFYRLQIFYTHNFDLRDN